MAGTLTLIGTGHVFRIEDAISGAIAALRPEVVYVELDRGRLHGLRQRRAGTAPPSQGNFIHRKLQAFQEGVARSYGAEAGGEMLAAVDAGMRLGADVRLIDRPADQTLRRVTREMRWTERARIAGMMTAGVARGLWPFGRRAAKDDIEAEIQRYIADPTAVLDELGQKFPTVRRVVIDERDALMSRRIVEHLNGRHGVAVVGDGHVGGMLRLLADTDLELTSYRLDDVRAGRLPKLDSSMFSFSFEVPATAMAMGDNVDENP